ncbi:hypothetical protein SDC9_148996 [bioreactor metagenome]|uniref:Uncharacterized protein n=1 Tax=bioreactor metagenome TaxID=1076179 RepID=A0A645EM95_9ZZZZ
MPRIDLKTMTFGFTYEIMSIVDLKGFQSIFIPGTEGSAFGIRRLEI